MCSSSIIHRSNLNAHQEKKMWSMKQNVTQPYKKQSWHERQWDKPRQHCDREKEVRGWEILHSWASVKIPRAESVAIDGD